MATINGTPLDDTINGLAVNDTLGAGRGGDRLGGRVHFSSRGQSACRAPV